jgi:hypothetical protein
MNKQTVYSILMDKFNRSNDAKEAQDASLKELIGQIVLTPFVIFFFLSIYSNYLSFPDTIMKHIEYLILLGIKIQIFHLQNVMAPNKL